jgi:exodeoxyribonuclease V gamma subunit
MAGLRLYISNRMEILARELAEVLSHPLASPLDPEVIVVQSKGMERWVCMELAQRNGISANCRFPFPNRFMEELFQAVIPDVSENPRFDPETLTWKIMKVLPACLGRPEFEGLRNYLGDTGWGLKSIQLCERIADTLDQYLVFRPEMILRWEQGQETHWQAMLWRELIRDTGKWHWAALGREFMRAVNSPPVDTTGLPERISVFGISALPRFHMEILSGIARVIEVNLFLMNPCQEYWGDIISRWEMKRKTILTLGHPTEGLHLEKGNSLLGSMGTLGRDFFDLVSEFDCRDYTRFQEPGESSLLSSLQSDILNLRDAVSESGEKRVMGPDDDSIQIHSCHGPMREIEVLHDQFLHLFEKDPDLKPRDILVMTPRIETYAPYIQAVFDTPDRDSPKIPFSIADRSIKGESKLIDTFSGILQLKGGRLGVSQVLAILESRAVQDRFGFVEGDLDWVRKWVNEARIRWGMDGQSRTDLGLPATPENTWRAGLDRLLLGYAMPGQEENLFKEIVPYDPIEGGETKVLGRLLAFIEALFHRVSAMGEPRCLRDWAVFLLDLLDALFRPDEAAQMEAQVLRRAINEIGDLQEAADFYEKVRLEGIKWYLGHDLEKKGWGLGFMTGGVTFCAMLPMRSIPFKVICLVGMNHDAYPRQSNHLGFDLMARHPLAGDRSRRNDDRYLFLEALLSARKNFYISYVGQGILDNSSIPPSTLVSELVDYIHEGFKTRDKEISDALLIRHRLQAFSPHYFMKKTDLFSYSRKNLQIARCMEMDRRHQVPFISERLPEPEEEWRRVDVRDLAWFFSGPARFLLNRRLGVHLEEATPHLEETEAFEIKGLEKYLLEETLVKKGLAGGDLRALLPVMQAAGRLPHGTVGECVFDGLRQGVERFVEKTRHYVSEAALHPLDVAVSLADFSLSGRIQNLYPERMAWYRYAKVTPRDRLRAWIYHLVLNSLAGNGHPRTSMVAGLAQRGPDSRWVAYEYHPVKNSRRLLQHLLETYWTGLMDPLHFFPKSSWEYAFLLKEKKRSPEESLDRAITVWEGNDFTSGECQDPYHQLCFGNTHPLDSAFTDVAVGVFGPLLDHQREIPS